MTDQEFDLPALHPLLKLYKAADNDGEPSWNLHHPVANTYFKISWAEFECLARFPKARTGEELRLLVEKETTLSIDMSEIKDLVIFLHSNGLLALNAKTVPFIDKKTPIWKKILHSYLYFTLPLCEPEDFLKRTLPYVRPLMSRFFLFIMIGVFSAGVLMTLQRLDEFAHSFTGFFSLEGIIRGLIVLIFIKIIHEFSHAYTAIKYGIPVPHMGVALIVMYPVLYTETTGGWQLSSRRARFHIAIAGITAELCLAALFLVVWNVVPAGSVAQSIAFTVVAVSFISSLLVNLNPLMRFDGYYMMSEIVGIDNLQSRACDFARWKIRKFLFGLKDDVPEYLPVEKEKFLVTFGLALLIYRFFLFVGIALLVYHVFFKPLGLIMMMVELVWFIGLPILNELKIWWQRRTEILQLRRAQLLMGVILLFVIAFIMPWQRTVYMPGVLHASQYSALYPYKASYIEDLKVKEGQRVNAGDVLAVLSSSALNQEFTATQNNLERLRRLQRRVRTDPALLQEKYASIDLEIKKVEQQLAALEEQKDKLMIVAPFSGQIRDLGAEIKAGRYVQRTDLLFRIINADQQVVTGYSGEDDLGRLGLDDKAVFIPDGQPFVALPLNLTRISDTDVESLQWPEVASLFNGEIPAELDRQSGQVVPLRSVYAVELQPQASASELPALVRVGEVRVSVAGSSPFVRFIKRLAAVGLREIGLN